MHPVPDFLTHVTVHGRDYLRFFHVITPVSGFDPFFLFELGVSLILLIACLWLPAKRKRPEWLRRMQSIARRRGLSVLAVCLLSVLGRLALLAIEPLPKPAVHDEFSYLLAADTFAHGHVTSPTPRDAEHFQAFHVLMTPTYQSMYPPSSGLFYALGQVLFGTALAGLLLVMALACGSLCWMLQAFVPPEWALLGGIIAVFRLSWFSYFGNSFWGGATAMLGGCLFLGAAGRLWRARAGRPGLLVALATGLLILFNNRPFEGGLLALPVVIGLVFQSSARRVIFSARAVPAFALLVAGLAASFAYAFQVTQSTKLPWSLQRQQWAIIPPFVFQPADYHHSYAFEDQKGLYEQYEPEAYNAQHHPITYVRTVYYKIFREWTFFIAPTLTACFLTGLLPTFRSRKTRPLALLFAWLSVTFFIQTWVQPQYVAIAAGILYVFFLNGLRRSLVSARANRGRPRLAGAILPATVITLLVMTVTRLLVVPLSQWPQGWGSRGSELVTFDKLNNWLRTLPGQQLVLVHYAPGHHWYDSWINNGADIAHQKVLWARDIPASNHQLLCDYPDRHVWLVTPPDDPEFEPDTTDPANARDVTGLLVPTLNSSQACQQNVKVGANSSPGPARPASYPAAPAVP